MSLKKEEIYKFIAREIPEKSKVLDLGCGDGKLLEYLIHKKQVIGHGIDIDYKAIIKCVEKGIPVVQRDFDRLSLDFPDNSFDVVVLNRTLQQILNPLKVISEILRIGKVCILGFPNFGNLETRLALGFTGTLPISPDLPYKWYDTPNIRLLTIKDFTDFCRDYKINVKSTLFLKNKKKGYKEITFLNNLRSDLAIFQLERNGSLL